MPTVAPSNGDVLTPLIRKARQTDAPAILEMVGQLARHHGDEPRASLAGLERDLFGPIPWVTALVADGGMSLLGYAILCRKYRAQSGERGVDLHHLFVVERVRNSGIGRRLVEAALDEARQWGCTFLVVGTHPENLEAQRFYEKLGFERAPQAEPRFRTAVGGSKAL
jgi:GNAT superfamily N-acetyltransferase